MPSKILHIQKEILEVLIEIKLELKSLKTAESIDNDELLDNSDAKRLLKIGDSTLYRWRKKKLIDSRLIGNKHYYLKSALVKLMHTL